MLATSDDSRPPRHIGGDIYLTILSRKYHILCGTVMHRRLVFESVGYFDPELKASEDYDLYFRVARDSQFTATIRWFSSIVSIARI